MIQDVNGYAHEYIRKRGSISNQLVQRRIKDLLKIKVKDVGKAQEALSSASGQ